MADHPQDVTRYCRCGKPIIRRKKETTLEFRQRENCSRHCASTSANKNQQRDFWTNERIEELERLVTSGEFTFEEIGQKMGRTKNAVLSKAHRLGLEGGKGHEQALRAIEARHRERNKPPEQEFPPFGHCLYALNAEMPYQFCGAPALVKRNPASGETFKGPWCPQHEEICVTKAGVGWAGLTYEQREARIRAMRLAARRTKEARGTLGNGPFGQKKPS